jgi:hypothetical protein
LASLPTVAGRRTCAGIGNSLPISDRSTRSPDLGAQTSCEGLRSPRRRPEPRCHKRHQRRVASGANAVDSRAEPDTGFGASWGCCPSCSCGSRTRSAHKIGYYGSTFAHAGAIFPEGARHKGRLLYRGCLLYSRDGIVVMASETGWGTLRAATQEMSLATYRILSEPTPEGESNGSL